MQTLNTPARPVSIRPMTAQDVSALAQILLGYPWTRYEMTRDRAEKVLHDGLAQNAQILVAQADGAPVGFVWFIQRGAFHHSGYIRLIGVAESAKGLGAGKALMEAAEQACAAQSADMFLLVSDFNASAQAFYQRMGYAQVGTLPDYVRPGIAELLMRKTLVV
ncbi:MAG TPA: GNAT family N-acetyltransferase [Thermoflexales bacterium]|nr:GNAT family N-acetyltransferase [Thermoflexales bacterium]HQW35485.1 GNAT family N-acetyltransferase [Thermoflexales bacterium]HQX75096.1 GNAT family N-acetyltransferase [Thermoflexales bacterium]HQZ21453.1 GNAT family N-acetyltransferase [Thermoflexales bacterium]HQZ99726.1 GNAT family N-acetyltransferase [Thermoflexales bacterium]